MNLSAQRTHRSLAEPAQRKMDRDGGRTDQHIQRYDSDTAVKLVVSIRVKNNSSKKKPQTSCLI